MKKIFSVICVLSLLLVGCGDTHRTTTNLDKYIKAGNYKNLKYKKEKIKVSENDINIRLKQMRKLNSYGEEKKTGFVKNGDNVKIDYIIKNDGRKEQTHNDENIIIGAGQSNNEFEKNLIGMKVGSSKTFNIPDKTTYEVKVKAIVVDKTPKLNDQFVKSQNIKGVNTVSDYKEYIKKEIIKEKKIFADETNDANLTSALLTAVNLKIDKNSNEIFPKQKLEEAKTEKKQKYKQIANQMGLSLQDYIKTQSEMNEKEFSAMLEEEAKADVREKMVIQYVAEKEKIKINENDYNKYIKKQIIKYPDSTKESFKNLIGTEDFDYQVLKNKILDLLKETAKAV